MSKPDFTGPHPEKVAQLRRVLIEAVASAEILTAVVVTADAKNGKTYANSATVIVATDPMASVEVAATVLGRLLGRAQSQVAEGVLVMPEERREAFLGEIMRVSDEEVNSARVAGGLSLVIEAPKGSDRRGLFGGGAG